MVHVSRFLWLSAPLKTLFSWGTVVMLPSQVQLGLQADHSTQGRTSVWLHLYGQNQGEGTWQQCRLCFIGCHPSSSDLPVTTSYPHCNAWAYLRAWQRPPAGSHPVTQQGFVWPCGRELCCAICPHSSRKGPSPAGCSQVYRCSL